VELSLQSLDLVFHLHPPPQVANDVPPPSTNLADSISEAAQLFGHEEITHEESTEAHRVFPSSGASHLNKNDDYVPGGLDASTDEPEVISDVDPTGISMFASMFEYLLSQFTFSAKDISITIINPGHSSFRFKVAELRYERPTSDCSGSTRTVSISGVEIAHRDLSTSESPSSGHAGSRSLRSSQCKFDAPLHRVDNTSLSSTVILPSSPPSSLKGKSSSNEPLPPVDCSTSEYGSRPSSLSGSTTSSIFQSALSTQGSTPTPGGCKDAIDPQDIGADDMKRDSSSATMGRLPSQTHETMDERLLHWRVIVSLATEPIVIHITTTAPPVSSTPSVLTQTEPHMFGPDPSGPEYLQPNLEVSVSVGIVACALAAPQISAILDVVYVMGPYSSPSSRPPISNDPGFVVPPLSLLDQAKLAIQIRGFALLLQSVPAPLTDSSHDVPLADFFAHPLMPPKTNRSYVRFLLDRLKADLSVSTTLEQVTDEPSPSLEHLSERSRVPRVVRGTTSSLITFSVGDLSAFTFCVSSNAKAQPASHGAFVFPIVLTDPFLFTQYNPEHQIPPNIEHHLNISPESTHAVPDLPEFEILDWMSENNRTSQAKLSLWRVRPPPGYRRSQRKYTGDSPISPPAASSSKAIPRETSANKPQFALSGQVSLSTPKDPGMSMGGSSESACRVQINITPLHAFVDMGGIATALDFLETLSGASDVASSSSEPKEDHKGARSYSHSGDPTPLSSLQRTTLQRVRQQELEDLDLSVDYSSKDLISGESPPGLRKVQRDIEVLCVLCSIFAC
jgi:autophagy-related protein 2